MKSEELKKIRERLGLTQQDFGERLGFAPKFARQQISAMERGVTAVSRRTTAVVAMLLKARPGRRGR